MNQVEVEYIYHLVNQLLIMNVDSVDIGIISFYKAQVDCLQKRLEGKNIKIATVDSFQGQEKRIIILSAVRSNRGTTLGFTDQPDRMNVAFTRAKTTLIIVGNEETLSQDPNWRKILRYVERQGCVVVV